MAAKIMSTLGELPWYWDRFDFFEGTSSEVREKVMARTERHEFRRGATIFRANDPATRIFLLEQGLVKIFHLSGQGEITIFWFCVPGDPFGAGGISGASEQAVFAQALERSVVHSLSRADFECLLHEHPRLAINMIKQVSGRLRLACDAVTDKITRRTDARLARILVRLARNWGELQGEEIRFRVRITHQELAHLAGSCRQTVSSILSDFMRQGLIRFERRILVVVRPELLIARMDD